MFKNTILSPRIRMTSKHQKYLSLSSSWETIQTLSLFQAFVKTTINTCIWVTIINMWNVLHTLKSVEFSLWKKKVTYKEFIET